MTEFEDLFRLLHRSNDIAATLDALRAQPRQKSKDGVDIAVRSIIDAIHRNRCGHAISAARALLVLAGPEKAIARLKRDGVLRASAYHFHGEAVGAIAEDWVRHANIFRISPAATDYVSSVAALVSLAPAVQRLYQSIRSRLRTDRKAVMKSLLAEIDVIFTFPEPEPVELDEAGSMPFSREELADGFSYLLGLFHRDLGLKAAHFALTDSSNGYDERHRVLLEDAAKLCRFREIEVLLEGFPYCASKMGSEIRISSRDTALTRSMKLGYIQTELQSYADIARLDKERSAGEIASLQTFADAYFAQHGNTVASLVLQPHPRYRLEVPMAPAMQTLFADDSAFVEEVSSMAALAWEDYITLDEVPGVLVSGSITVRDVVKVQRLLGFTHYGLVTALSKHGQLSDNAALYRNSCLPVFRLSALLKVIAFAVGDEKAEEMCTLLTADLSSPSLDLQYAPVIVAGDYAIMSLAVLSRSNLVRNLLARLKRRIGPVGKGDSMQSALAGALARASFAVEQEIELSSGANPFEVDVLAYRDGALFVFECKNAYAPCNVYEMRNTFEAITKAFSQLAVRMDWLSIAANQKALFTRLGWPLPAQLRVQSCVALGNRVFNGYDSQGHPVRQVQEMINLLEHGSIDIDERRIRMWKGDAFTVDDLVHYLHGSTIHADFASAMEPFDEVTDFGGSTLVQPGYALDLVMAKEAMQGRYKAVGVDIAAPG